MVNVHDDSSSLIYSPRRSREPHDDPSGSRVNERFLTFKAHCNFSLYHPRHTANLGNT